MSFIKKDGQIVVNTKLTNTGRNLLASGKLNFAKFALGDSEIDYAFAKKYGTSIQDKRILRPVDGQPDLKHTIAPSLYSVDNQVALDVPTPTPVFEDKSSPSIGFFTGSDATGYNLKLTPDYIKSHGIVKKLSVTGNMSLVLDDIIDVTAGDYVLVAWKNPDGSLLVNSKGFIDNFAPAQYIWYKAMSVSGTTITVDKAIPDFRGGAQEGDCYVYVFPKGEAIDYYYGDSRTPNTNMKVWNLTISHSHTMEGANSLMKASGYPSADYVGIGKQLGVDNKMVGIVHFSNYSSVITYGDAFIGNSFTLNLPTVMYHRGNGGNNGLTLVTDSTEKKQNHGEEYSQSYRDLTDLNGFVVGRVFNDLKLAIITDQEILAAISLKSNRNWTLPEIPYVHASAEETGEDFYFTYHFLSGNNGTPNTYDTQRSLGFGTALHCQHLNKVDAKKINYVEFSFKLGDFRFMRDASTIGTSYGSGFSANKFILLMQRVPKGEQPKHDQWYGYDYTPHLRSDYSTWSTNAIPVSAMTDSTHRITEEMYRIALGGLPYSLSYLENNLVTQDNSQSMQATPKGDTTGGASSEEECVEDATPNTNGTGYPGFTFGEESLLLGNVTASTRTTTYRTRLIANLETDAFNVSDNPTWVAGDSVFISEVGVYDDKNNLVMIGKPNYPIEKRDGSVVVITLDMDF
jgi:hypothetical protein